MGLHLNFELRLPGATPRDHVLRVLEQLRAFALGTPVARVTPIFAADLAWEGGESGADPLEGFFRLWSSILGNPSRDHPDFGADVDAPSASGFVIMPGEGCEAAPVGFIRRRFAAHDVDEWHWHTCCKTQYASVVSDEHLVTCHTALVALLDHAIALGVDVEVHDETGYWESRDTSVLLDSVHKMNRIVAAFAGRMSDAIQGQVESPIFEHRRFERLEMGE